MAAQNIVQEYAIDEVRDYLALELDGATVESVEKIAAKRLRGTRYTIWDVRTDQGRWWVIDHLMNRYSQEKFPSLDMVFTFHLGLMDRLLARDALQATRDDARVQRITATLRRLQQAAEALGEAEEPEDLQAVGTRLRETLRGLAREIAGALQLSVQDAPKAGDFLGWAHMFAESTAPGDSGQRLRAYLKETARATWDLVQWLTHAENATRHDAEIALGATDNLVASFLTGIVKHERGEPDRCPRCSSYRVRAWYLRETDATGYYVNACEACDWESEPTNQPSR